MVTLNSNENSRLMNALNQIRGLTSYDSLAASTDI